MFCTKFNARDASLVMQCVLSGAVAIETPCAPAADMTPRYTVQFRRNGTVHTQQTLQHCRRTAVMCPRQKLGSGVVRGGGWRSTHRRKRPSSRHCGCRKQSRNRSCKSSSVHTIDIVLRMKRNKVTRQFRRELPCFILLKNSKFPALYSPKATPSRRGSAPPNKLSPIEIACKPEFKSRTLTS